jgi:ankyrin repeat protein
MPTVHTLPENPRLDRLRGEARALQRAVQAGDPAAVARVQRQHPDGVPADPTTFRLTTAQLVVAREYGLPSWPRLRRYLDLVADHGWDATSADRPANDPADELCRLACLSYQHDDGPDRWARARRLLAERPDLTGDHVWAAATAAQPAPVRRLLDADPALARRRGGPYHWTPLFHLAYSRLDPAVPADAVLTVARQLLDAGASPAEGYLWNGRPYPFTLLTGAFGEGELGPERQPRHPHSLALARLLLDAGANPNDSQTLYNRQFRPDDDHLELLLAYGLGTGDGYPWQARLGGLVDPPAELLRVQLRWAIWHDLPDRVRLLVRHGVDFRSPFRAAGGGPAWLPDDQRTPAELAAWCGNLGIVEFLTTQDAHPPALDPAGALVAAAFRADRAAVEGLRAAHPAAAAQAQRDRPGLIVWAAAQGRTETVALLAELGFDVNARGRGDVPVEGGHDTALHHAAARGDLELARLLLSLGADPDIVGGYHATPLGWARHFGHQPIVDLLT